MSAGWSGWYLGPRAGGPVEAADGGVDAGRARLEVGGARCRTDGRRRHAVKAVDLVLYVADDRTHDETGTLALLPLAHIPADRHHHMQ